MSKLQLITFLVSVTFIGVNAQIKWQPGGWALQCDFRGKDMQSKASRGSECGSICESTSGCTHFVWANWNGGTCFMKTGGATKGEAVFNGDWSYTCGILGESGGNGNTGDSGSSGNNDAAGSGDCKLRFGMPFDGNDKDYGAADYVTIWMGSDSSDFGNNFNPYYHGDMLKTCKAQNKLPVFYAYTIAFMARKQWGLQDCNVANPSLCQKGANFIRSKRGEIVAQYKQHAAESAKIMGKDGEILWLIEPDFLQYYHDGQQEGGTLSGQEMRSFFDDLVGAIKSELPNAKISWDISPWLSEGEMRQWWGYFASSPDIDYIHTSGGGTQAASSEIRPGQLRWKFMSELTGKGIFADSGYGVGGASEGHDWSFDDENNLRQRINDGLVGVSQGNPRGDWKATTDSLRSKLPKARC